MAHSVTGKLNKAATQFQAGDGTGFGVRLGVQYYDRETKQKEWTNYEAVIFANQPAQVDFYKSALVEGSVVELSGESLKVKTFDGQNGQQITLELIGAKLGYVHTGQQNNAPAQNQGGYQQPQPQYNQAPQQQSAPQQQGQPTYQQGSPQAGGYAPQQGGFNPNQAPDGIPF